MSGEAEGLRLFFWEILAVEIIYLTYCHVRIT